MLDFFGLCEERQFDRDAGTSLRAIVSAHGAFVATDNRCHKGQTESAAGGGGAFAVPFEDMWKEGIGKAKPIILYQQDAL